MLSSFTVFVVPDIGDIDPIGLTDAYFSTTSGVNFVIAATGRPGIGISTPIPVASSSSPPISLSSMVPSAMLSNRLESGITLIV